MSASVAEQGAPTVSWFQAGEEVGMEGRTGFGLLGAQGVLGLRTGVSQGTEAGWAGRCAASSQVERRKSGGNAKSPKGGSPPAQLRARPGMVAAGEDRIRAHRGDASLSLAAKTTEDVPCCRDLSPWYLHLEQGLPPSQAQEILSQEEHLTCLCEGFEKLENLSFTPMSVTSPLEIQHASSFT